MEKELIVKLNKNFESMAYQEGGGNVSVVDT